MLSSLVRRCSAVASKVRTSRVLFARSRGLLSRSYTTKIKPEEPSASYAPEKPKEKKQVNLLTEEQTDLLSLSSPTTQARLVELCSQSRQFDVIKKLFLELLNENTMKVHLMKLLTKLGEIEVENLKYDKEIIELADLAIKQRKLARKEAALVLLKIFLWRGRMHHVLELLQQLERIGITITESLYYEVLRLGLYQQKYEFMNATFQEMFSKGIKPTPLTYSLMARAYAAAGKKDLADVLVDKIQLTDYNIDIIYNLIFMHCVNGDTFKAINLLDILLKHPGAVTEKEEIKVWKAIFLSFKKVRPPMNVVNDVVKMSETRNFKFMDEVYLSVIRSLPDVKYVEEFVHSLKKRKVKITSTVWMELITMQAQRGFYNASLYSWKEMLDYGVEITKKRCEQMIGLAQFVKRSEARFTFQRIRELVFEPMKKLPEDQRPDAHTYNLMIKAALLMKRPAKALELFDEYDAQKLPVNSEEKMITRKDIEEIAELKQTFEKDQKKRMETYNPLSRGVNFDRSDVIVIAELIRHYLKEYSDSNSVAAWDSLPPKKLNKYFTLTERQIIQQKGIDLDNLPTAFDPQSGGPVVQFSSQKQEAEDKARLAEEELKEQEQSRQNYSEVFNKDDFDEVWMLEENNDGNDNQTAEVSETNQSQEPKPSNEEIIAKNSEITSESRNFNGAVFSADNHWRSFFFVYNRLVGEGFGYTLAQAKQDMRIKMLDPNNKFFKFIKERVTEQEFNNLTGVYQDSRKYKKYSVYWNKVNRSAEEREKNREIAREKREASLKAKEERIKATQERRRLKEMQASQETSEK